MVTLPELGHFTGSQNIFYDRLFKDINYTEGVKYVRDNGASWLITDILANIRYNKKISMYLNFLVIEAIPGEPVKVVYKNDTLPVFTQKYEISDLGVRVKFYFIDGMLMLASEY
jgi:hypothetical protein